MNEGTKVGLGNSNLDSGTSLKSPLNMGGLFKDVPEFESEFGFRFQSTNGKIK